jgi:VIT1/CCC1 family predicted Fe2+/Mn2+ transporter
VTLSSTKEEVATSPSAAAASISEVLAPFELPHTLTDDLSLHLLKSPHLVQFLMHFQHTLPEPASSRAMTCALTIAAGYFFGGFIPLLPYFLVPRTEVLLALYWSLGVMALCLFIFGYTKTCFVSGWKGTKNTWEGTKGGLQMMVVGGIAAGCAMGLVRLFHSWAPI